MARDKAGETAAKAWAWELLGLLVVLAVGGAVMAALWQGIGRASAEAETRREAEAAEGGPAETPVDVTVVAAETVRDTARLPGLVFANASVRVPVEVNGVVARRLAENGARVKKGDVLVELDDRDARIARARAAAALALEQAQFARERELHANHVTTAAALDKATAAHTAARADDDDAALALERCAVRSPLDGYVAHIDPEPGERLQAGDVVAVVVDLDRVKVRVGISERDLAEVRGVTEATVHAGGPPPHGFRATGRRTYLALEPRADSQVYVLELLVDNPELVLRPGMFVEAEVVRAVDENSARIPAFAVMPHAGGHAVMRVEPATDGGETAHRTPVRLGVLSGDSVAIPLDGDGGPGLRAGDRLVVNGQRTLEDGERVRIRRVVADVKELTR